jgi:hypothetical protein
MTTLDQSITRRATIPFGRTPITGVEFAMARETAAHTKPVDLRRQMNAMLLLARGAGATASDMSYVAGTDVVAVAKAGLWVEFTRPGHERRVPVLHRFADDLRQLARQARGGPLLGTSDQSLPLPASTANGLVQQLLDRLCAHRPGALITVERLRRAWLVEQLTAPLPLREFLQVTGERSLQAIRDLSDFCSAPEIDSLYTARLMGGVGDPEIFDLAAWGLD